MSAWYVLSAAGFYPVTPGSPIYAIGAPLFPEVRFNLENGKTLAIKARDVSEKNIYIQTARLNGKAYSKSFFTHQDLMNGGELIFEMGPRPNERWGTGEGNEPVSKIEARSIVPAPVIRAKAPTFKDQLTVELLNNSTDASPLTIHYSRDNSNPTSSSPTFTAPVTIDQTTTLKARAFDQQGRGSFVTTAKFHRIPHDWTLQLLSRHSSQYTGGGDFALIDGIRGTTNWSGGGWQGYQGRDLVAVVDLGSVQSVSKFGAGFLQDIGSWIFMPRRVEFEVSTDGKIFTPVVSVANDTPDGQTNTGVVIKDFVGRAPAQARYVRVRAVNYGKLPEWHPGSGGAAWIFVDEIFVE
jgi:hypothetical protein